jgi:hypothetical protein
MKKFIIHTTQKVLTSLYTVTMIIGILRPDSGYFWISLSALGTVMAWRFSEVINYEENNSCSKQ